MISRKKFAAAAAIFLLLLAAAVYAAVFWDGFCGGLDGIMNFGQAAAVSGGTSREAKISASGVFCSKAYLNEAEGVEQLRFRFIAPEFDSIYLTADGKKVENRVFISDDRILGVPCYIAVAVINDPSLGEIEADELCVVGEAEGEERFRVGVGMYS